MFSRRVIGAVVAIVAASDPLLSAQSAGVGTGAVVGVVRDAAGLPAQGASITISGDRLMAPRTVTTRPDGEYLFVSLPPGDYDLTFVLAGFDSLERRAHVGL